MKILHIAPTPFFADRGCHIRILGEVRDLQSLGHDVVLATYHNGRNVDDLNIKRIVNVPWYNKLSVGSSWHKIYLDLLLFITSLRICYKTKPDIIHAHLHEGALIGKTVSLFVFGKKIPVIFDLQGSLAKELEIYGFFRNMKFLKSLFKVIEKIICRLPDYFVCSAESNAEFLKHEMNVDKDKIYTVIDRISPEFFSGQKSGLTKEKLGIPDNNKIILYTGSLIKSKGINYLLDSIPRLAEKYNEGITFLIAGYPVEESEKKVENLNVQEIVRFTGKIDFFKLPEYLSLADVAVDPKTDGANEGSGKMINYMAAGLPVVCFDTLNNRSFLGEKGIYAKLGDSEDLANKITKVLRDGTLARETGDANKKRVYEKFSTTSIGQALNEVYVKALKQP